jgi:hypothetical protein
VASPIIPGIIPWRGSVPQFVDDTERHCGGNPALMRLQADLHRRMAPLVADRLNRWDYAQRHRAIADAIDKRAARIESRRE